MILSLLVYFNFFPRSKFSASDQRTLALLSYFSRIKLNTRHCSRSSEGRNFCATMSLLSCIPYTIPWSQVAIHVMHTEVISQKGYGILLYRRECFTGKYTTLKIHTKLHPGTEWRIFHILTSEDIDDVISRSFTVVCPNSQ